MTTTTTPTNPEPTAPDYSDLFGAIDYAVEMTKTADRAWLDMFDLLPTDTTSSQYKTAVAAGQDHFVSEYPNGVTGKSTNPKKVWQNRVKECKKVRSYYPQTGRNNRTAEWITSKYGSVRDAYVALTPKKESTPKKKTEPTHAERLAAVDEAIRLAFGSGVDIDAIDTQCTDTLNALPVD